MGIIAILTYVFSFISKSETRSEFHISLFFQNAIFFPLAILSGMFGDASIYIVYLFLFTIFYPAFFFNIYYYFFKNQKVKINWRRILNNVLIATFIGLFIALADFQKYIPSVIVQIFSLLGAMTLPLIMLIIGGNIYIDYQQKGKLYLTEIVKFVLIKNIIFPLIIMGVLLLLRPAFHIALLFITQAAVPPVTSVPIFTGRAGGNQRIVNQFVVASFILSLITIPIMISLFGYFFPF